MKKYNLSRIMRTAWVTFREGIETIFSNALSKAWKAERILLLQELLPKKIVCFEFVKNDKSIRRAYGTTMKKIIEGYEFKETSVRPEASAVLNFFDTEISLWRSCRIDRLIKIL